MKSPGGGLQAQLKTFGAKIPVQNALGFQHGFKCVAVLQEDRALVAAVVPRQMLGNSRCGRVHPRRVLDQEVGPTDGAVRIRIADRRSDRRPWPAMRRDQRRSPFRLWK